MHCSSQSALRYFPSIGRPRLGWSYEACSRPVAWKKGETWLRSFPVSPTRFRSICWSPRLLVLAVHPQQRLFKTPLTRFKRGEKPAITLNIPMVSAIMQSVSEGVDMGVALVTEGGLSFIYGSPERRVRGRHGQGRQAITGRLRSVRFHADPRHRPWSRSSSQGEDRSFHHAGH